MIFLKCFDRSEIHPSGLPRGSRISGLGEPRGPGKAGSRADSRDQPWDRGKCCGDGAGTEPDPEQSPPGAMLQVGWTRGQRDAASSQLSPSLPGWKELRVAQPCAQVLLILFWFPSGAHPASLLGPLCARCEAASPEPSAGQPSSALKWVFQNFPAMVFQQIFALFTIFCKFSPIFLSLTPISYFPQL